MLRFGRNSSTNSLKLLSKNTQTTTPQANKTPSPQTTNHNPTNRQTIFLKTLARRNARKRSAAPPWGVPGVLDQDTQFLSGFDRSQISKPQIPGSRCRAQDPCQTRRGFNPSLPPRRPRTFRRADPKIAGGRFFGLKMSNFSRFLHISKIIKISLFFAFSQTRPKSILSRHLAPPWPLFSGF